MMVKASGLPDVAIEPIASSVSEKSSLANLPTASSNAPANAGSANAIRTIESANVRRRERTLAGTLTSPAEEGRRRQHRRLLRSYRGSGALTAAFVGLDVVVAALLADPIADQVLG